MGLQPRANLHGSPCLCNSDLLWQNEAGPLYGFFKTSTHAEAASVHAWLWRLALPEGCLPGVKWVITVSLLTLLHISSPLVRVPLSHIRQGRDQNAAHTPEQAFMNGKAAYYTESMLMHTNRPQAFLFHHPRALCLRPHSLSLENQFKLQTLNLDPDISSPEELSQASHLIVEPHGWVQGAFHGRTMGAMAVTSSKTFYRTGFAPLMPQVFIAPYPYCLHCKVRQHAPDGKDWYKVSPASTHMHAGMESRYGTMQ